MKIVLGIGGSPDSFRALKTMLKIYHSQKHKLTIALLENPKNEESLEELKQKVRAYLKDKEFDIDLRQLAGKPGGRLVSTAETENYNLIVLGGGMRSPMGKYRVGNIAEYVLVNSSVSVTLIR